jgi:RecG-like helicase
VLAEISADLARGQPMQRLLQGDVGSGKTLVAALAAAQAVEAGAQYLMNVGRSVSNPTAKLLFILE